MFLQAKNKKPKDDVKTKKQDLSARLDQDIVVHNMPSKTALAGSSYSQEGRGAIDPAGHKKIGLIIIIIGLLVIGVIFYLAYVFMIKPAAQPQPAAPTETASGEASTSQIADANPPAPVAPQTDANITDANLASTTVAVATSSATSSIVFPSGEQVVASATPAALDSDGDSLNDIEETILGTNPNLADSDGDGFNDLAEIQAGYDPISSGRLEANANLAKYSVAKYEISYPKTWTLKPLTTDEAVIFTAPDDSFIQLSVQKNASGQSIMAWYQGQFAVSDISASRLLSKTGGEGVLSEDGLTVYFTDSSRQNIYILSYTPIDDKNLLYPDIFKLMLDSLVIKS